jgi:hypothetical protein
LVDIIQKNNVGRVSTSGDQNSLGVLASELLDLLNIDRNVKDRCRNLYLKLFTPKMAVKQIVYALENKDAAI